MRKIIVYLTIFLLSISMVFAASVSRDLPSRADPNSELTVKLMVSGADTSGLFTLEEALPAGVTVKDWTVTGATEAKSAITTRVKDGYYGWSFTPSGSSVTVEYTIDLGSTDVSFGTLVFFDKAGQGNVNGQTLKVAPMTCGDGICEGTENSDNCEADCPKAPPPATPTETTPVAEGEAPTNGWIWYIVIAAIVIIAIVIFSKKGKKKE